MKKSVFSVLLILVLLVSTFGIAYAITDGEPDGEGHPYVGLMVADDAAGNPLWRCSGTLISPTVFLTAGHCTEAPAARATIWFETDVQSNQVALGYPRGGATSVDGTTYTHPQFNPAAFYLYDLGVVVLDTPVVMAEYGALPQLNQLDALKTKRGQQDVTFTAAASLGGRDHPADNIAYVDEIVGAIKGHYQPQPALGAQVTEQPAHLRLLVVVGSDNPARENNHCVQAAPDAVVNNGGGLGFGAGVGSQEIRHREFLDFSNQLTVRQIRKGMDRADIDQPLDLLLQAGFDDQAGSADIDLLQQLGLARRRVDQACQVEHQAGAFDSPLDISRLADIPEKDFQGHPVEHVQFFVLLQKQA